MRILAAGACSAILPLLERLSRGGSSFKLLRFSTAEDVAAHVRDWPLDLLFVDADCAAICAAELCHALKQHRATRLLSVLVVSCSARACSEALAAGADDFLTPQIPPEVLLTRLEALAQLSLARRRLSLGAVDADEPRPEEVRQVESRRLLPPLEEIAARGDPFVGSGEQTHAVVVSVALRGYSRMCECLSLDDVVSALDEYFWLLTEITCQHEGAIFQLAGRRLLVGFEESQGLPGGPERALRAAQEMLSRFAELALAWRKRFNLVAGLSIGVSEGAVVPAIAGSARFMNHTLIGDVVNVAARLCQRARVGEMVLSDAFKHSLDAVGLDLPALRLPSVTLRGRLQPVDIFCVGQERRVDLYSPPYPESAWQQRAPSKDEEALRLALLPHEQARMASHRR